MRRLSAGEVSSTTAVSWKRAARAGAPTHSHRRSLCQDHAMWFPSSAVRMHRHSEASASLANAPATVAAPSRSLVRTCAQESDYAGHVAQCRKLADELDKRQADLQFALEERACAVRQERFSDAAVAARKVQDIESQDIVASLRADQATAVEEQDFVRAASLQKARLAALLGWWQIAPDKKDVRGHVLHVSEAYGKLVGRVYSASDLAKILGCTPENKLGLSPSPQLKSQLGTTVFEVIFQSLSGSGVFPGGSSLQQRLPVWSSCMCAWGSYSISLLSICLVQLPVRRNMGLFFFRTLLLRPCILVVQSNMSMSCSRCSVPVILS
jgi:hypothetical protein